MTTSAPARTWARRVAKSVAAASFSEMWTTFFGMGRFYTPVKATESAGGESKWRVTNEKIEERFFGQRRASE